MHRASQPRQCKGGLSRGCHTRVGADRGYEAEREGQEFQQNHEHPSPHSGGVHRSAESVAHRRVSGGGAQYPFGDD